MEAEAQDQKVADEQTVARPASMLERLREQRTKTLERKTTSLPIPGYRDPELVPVYRLLNEKEAATLGVRVRGETDQEAEIMLAGSAAILIEACVGIYFRRPGTGKLETLDAEGLGEITFEDSRLGDILGFTASSAREALRAVFCDNPHAIIDHSRRLQEWMSDTTLRIDEGALGES